MATRTEAPEVQEPEVVEADTTALEAITAGEVSSQVATARRYPRSVTSFRKRAIDMATLDDATALSCLYALPRGNKTIEGPSARLAEILQICYGNTRTGGRVVQIDKEFVTAQAVGWDMESNSAVSSDVKRRITDKHGKRYNEDMIGVTSNAAISIGIRNVTLKIIPQALWRPVYLAARAVVAGDATTLAKRRQEMLDVYMKMGVRNEAVFAVLEINGVEDITLDHIVTMRATYESIRSGELTIDGVFNAADAIANRKDPLDDYLGATLDEHLVKDIRDVLAKIKMNKGQIAAKLAQYATKPKDLLKSLQKHLAEHGAASAPTTATTQTSTAPAQTTQPPAKQEKVEPPTAGELFGGGNGKKSASASKFAQSGEDEF